MRLADKDELLERIAELEAELAIKQGELDKLTQALGGAE